jgi:hypothetical protein
MALIFIDFALDKDCKPWDYDYLASEIFHCIANIVKEEIMIFIFLHLKSYHFLLNAIHY